MKIAMQIARISLIAATVAALLFPPALLLLYSATEPKALERVLAAIHSPFAEHRLLRLKFNFLTYFQIATESRKFAVAFLNSLNYSLITTLGQLLLATPAAIALAVLKFKARYVIIPLYFIIMMMPFQVTMVPSFLTLYYFRMLDHPLAIIVPQLFFPFSVILLYLFIIQIPQELYEAANVDGAGTIRLVVHIVLPLIRHGVWSIGLLHFIDSWNMIEQPLVFLTSMDLLPLSILIRQSLEINAADIFVPAVLFMLPIIIIYGIYHKFIVSGLQISIAGNQRKGI